MKNDAPLVLKVLERLLRPVVRLCLRQGIKLNDLVEVLKVTMVRVANEDLTKQKSEQSLSRVSVMTGVHRKDVTRISRSDTPIAPKANLVGKLIVQWQHDPRFRNAAGKARVLSAQGKESEFAKLVQSVNGNNLNPYTVLSELLRNGIVEKSAKGVRLASRLYLVETGKEEGLDMLAGDAEDLISAVEENLFLSNQVKNLHLKTEFDNVVEEALPTVRQWLLDRGSEFHREVRNFISKFDRDLNPECKGGGKRVRVVFGTFGNASVLGSSEA